MLPHATALDMKAGVMSYDLNIAPRFNERYNELPGNGSGQGYTAMDCQVLCMSCCFSA